MCSYFRWQRYFEVREITATEHESGGARDSGRVVEGDQDGSSLSRSGPRLQRRFRIRGEHYYLVRIHISLSAVSCFVFDVIVYSSDDVCVLSASGTAAVINMQVSHAPVDELIAAAQEQQHTPPPPLQGSQNPPNLSQRATNRDRVVMTTSLDRTDFERERLATKGDSSTPVRTDVSLSIP